MAVPEFMPKDLGGQIVRVMEEASEVIKEAAKLLRFGDRIYEGKYNSDRLEDEVSDLNEAMSILRRSIAETTPSERTLLSGRGGSDGR